MSNEFEEQEEEFVVEYISQAKVVEDGEGGLEWVYKLHWVGYPEDRASHEHDNGFLDELLDEFWQATGKPRDVKHYAEGDIVHPSTEYIDRCKARAVQPEPAGHLADSEVVEDVKDGVTDIHLVEGTTA